MIPKQLCIYIYIFFTVDIEWKKSKPHNMVNHQAKQKQKMSRKYIQKENKGEA
jgi:hypothetical protein